MLLIENGFVCDPKSGTEKNADVFVVGDRIRKIGTALWGELSEEEKAQVKRIDATGKVVAPGLVDVHVHFREPGFTHKEDIQTGARSAAAGGVTSIVLMANTKPCVDNVETLAEVIEKGKATPLCIYTCGNVTMGMKGEKLTNMALLKSEGAVGFTDDGIPIMDEELVREAMRMAKELDVPISFHEEDPSLITNNGVNAGKASEYFGIGGSPREAEYTLVERDVKLALETGAQIDVQHISTKEAVEFVRQARRQGDNVHAEACPHHFTLTEDAVIKYGTLAKMNPPLRTEEDRMAVIRGLQDGTIDMIATDHAPHTMEEKGQSITSAPSGIIGLETSLPLTITQLYKTGYLTLLQIFEKMCYNPAKLYHFDAGYLAEDGPADMIIVDVEQTQVFTKYESKACNTPFTGWELTGVVEATICKGQVVYTR